ncbi:MAG: helicase associated domain-containing protein [Bacteroidota bacterium]
MTTINKNRTLTQLHEDYHLNVRAITVCETAGLSDLNSLLNYYLEKNNFLELRYCGVKTNNILSHLCDDNLHPNGSENFVSHSIKNRYYEILKISNESIQFINNIMNIVVKNLSVNSSSALQYLIKGKIDFYNLYNAYALLKNQIDRMVTRRIIREELRKFYLFYKNLLNILNTYKKDHEIKKHLYISYLEYQFHIDKKGLDSFYDYDYKSGLPYFGTVFYLIKNNVLFTELQSYILFYCINAFKYDNKDLHIIADEFGKTYERIRQIRHSLFNKHYKNFLFLRLIENKFWNLYDIDFSSEFIHIDNKLLTKINDNENTFFNNCGIAKFLHILIKNDYDIIGKEINTLYNTNRKTAHNWKNLYLVSKRITNRFDFELFIEKIYSIYNQPVSNSYTLPVDLIIEKSFKNVLFANNSTKQVHTIAFNILKNEFDTTIISDHKINIVENKKMHLYQYALEALELIGRPAHILEIIDKVKEIHPGIQIAALSLKNSMKRDKGFIPISRKSIFGLLKWKNRDDMKLGSIRELAEELIIKAKKPVHIDDIVDYVTKSFDTNKKYITSNLRADKRRFDCLNYEYFGLKKHNYGKKLLSTNKIKLSWDEKFSILQNFVIKNNRLPGRSYANEDEIKIFRFLAVQRSAINKGKLDEKRKKMIIDLICSVDY